MEEFLCPSPGWLPPKTSLSYKVRKKVRVGCFNKKILYLIAASILQIWHANWDKARQIFKIEANTQSVESLHADLTHPNEYMYIRGFTKF